MPTSATQGRIHIAKSLGYFASFDCSPDYRLCIHISSAGEIIYYGFGNAQMAWIGGPINMTDVDYRLRRPDGSTAIGQSDLPLSGQGFSSTYAQAIAGPEQLPGASATGYQALSFIADMVGDWYIEFYYPDYNNSAREFAFFDITVASGNTAIPGRIWSKAWQLSGSYIPPLPNEFYGTLYTYSNDSIVTSFYMNGIRIEAFCSFCNNRGTGSTSNPLIDRKSKTGFYKFPQYKIFLNNPDPVSYPTGSLGQFTEPPTVTTFCNGEADISIKVNKPGQVSLVLEFDPSPGIQSLDREYIFDVAPGVNILHWDGKNGIGQYSLNGTIVPVTVSYMNGITHFPVFDINDQPGGFIVELVRPAGSTPKVFWDDSGVGGTTELDGCVSASTGCHIWPNYFGDSKTINTWWYSGTTSSRIEFSVKRDYIGSIATEICQNDSIYLNGVWVSLPGIYTINTSTSLGCDSTITIILTLNPAPSVQLPPDQSLCNVTSFELDAGPGFATYLWNTGETTQKIVISHHGTYWVTVTALNGCSDTDEIVITTLSSIEPKLIKHN
ncbi:MAG TPA: hypothetical protein DF296_06420 [Candidatus Margulisbacteria bacterium]|nr:hypothetical protein [Candidatus Margulisiibacteriota bacterium]